MQVSSPIDFSFPFRFIWTSVPDSLWWPEQKRSPVRSTQLFPLLTQSTITAHFQHSLYWFSKRSLWRGRYLKLSGCKDPPKVFGCLIKCLQRSSTNHQIIQPLIWDQQLLLSHMTDVSEQKETPLEEWIFVTVVTNKLLGGQGLLLLRSGPGGQRNLLFLKDCHKLHHNTLFSSFFNCFQVLIHFINSGFMQSICKNCLLSMSILFPFNICPVLFLFVDFLKVTQKNKGVNEEQDFI